ncbi:MAG TPA: FAD-binding oxidoreductase [Jiangellales bacterium]|nr:FAD-binding oxidoreductase [Jiangellales bacterium]
MPTRVPASPSPTTAETVSRLRRQVRGRVVTPGDDDYDRARSVFYGGLDRRPAAVVQVLDAGDVARVVSFAADGGHELAVRGGGHSAVGHGVSDGGVTIDLSHLRDLEIDPDGRSAWAATGLTAGEYTAAVGAHGLATGFGDTGTVGIGGITLGGGVGFLVRRHGLTVDSLLAAEVVTADGSLRRVDLEHEPDLFWALRGGGGNVGVATRLRFRLHEVPSVLGGMLVLPATPDVIASLLVEAEVAGDDLSLIANVMTAPPMPFLAPEHHGRPVVMVLLAHCGAETVAERDVARLRSLATPLADQLGRIPYAGMFPPEPEGYRPTGVSRTMFADAVDRARAERVLDALATSSAPMAVAQLRVLGGAMARVPADATAFAHRDRRLMVNVAALYEDPAERPAHEAWVRALSAELADGPGAYVNFLGDDGAARIHEAYPGDTWDRLVAVKRRYDPGNLFRLNHNVPPA